MVGMILPIETSHILYFTRLSSLMAKLVREGNNREVWTLRPQLFGVRSLDTQTPTLLCQKSGHSDPNSFVSEVWTLRLNSFVSEVWTLRPQLFCVRSLDTHIPTLLCQKSGHSHPNSLTSEVWTLRPQLFCVRSLDTQTQLFGVKTMLYNVTIKKVE
ncbi:hypothetical protein Bpfe_001457, partial [Biomphalaria pfeifferi]